MRRTTVWAAVAIVAAIVCAIESGSSASADSTLTPTPVIERGDVNCDHVFDVHDPLDLLRDLSGVETNVTCAAAAGLVCSGQLYPNAVLILLGELAGVTVEIPPCLPPSDTPTPTPDGTPTPTPNGSPGPP